MKVEPRSAIILMVEDDPNDVLFLQRAFKKAGVTLPVRVARDGQEAVDYLARKGRFRDPGKYPTPCIVILDLKLPKLTGIEVLQWLRGREEFRDLPVVMVTSSDEEEDRATALRHGIESYAVKPVSMEALIRLAMEIRLEIEDHCKNAHPCKDESGP